MNIHLKFTIKLQQISINNCANLRPLNHYLLDILCHERMVIIKVNNKKPTITVVSLRMTKQ